MKTTNPMLGKQRRVLPICIMKWLKETGSQELGINPRPDWLKGWVVNLSDQPVSKEQEEVLALGLNFAPAPKKVLFTDTIAAMEEGTHELTPDQAEEYRGELDPLRIT